MPGATPEFWSPLLWANDPTPRGMIDRALKYEAEGWDGVMCPDTQNLMADLYVCLTAIAMETTSLMMGAGVTNPVEGTSKYDCSTIAQKEYRKNLTKGYCFSLYL